MKFDDECSLGLDIGIGSIGWALLRVREDAGAAPISRAGTDGRSLEALGVRAFPVPENPKTRELLNKARRTARGQRRRLSRRAQRMRAIRSLLEAHGLAGARDVAALHHARGKAQADPWRLRAEALTRALSDTELTIALLHIAKHRGFRSNSKRDATESGSDAGKMRKAAEKLEHKFQETRKTTMGEWLAEQPVKRNRAGADGKARYEHTILRKFQAKEAAVIFEKQRALGNTRATPLLEEAYARLAFEQRPLRSTAELVGRCSFLPDEPRAPRFAPTSERFRLAAKLATLTLSGADGEKRSCTQEEMENILSLLGEQKTISYTAARKRLSLPSDIRFEGLSYGKRDKNGKEVNPETADIATRTGSSGAGTYAFHSCLGGDAFKRLLTLPIDSGGSCLDAAAKIISDNDDLAEIENQLARLPLRADERDALIQDARKGTFGAFKGTMHLCVKAMREILPHLIETRSYEQGCALAGFDPGTMRRANLDDVRNPLVRRILRELRRQLRTVIVTFGVIPGRVHVELARDVAKSAEERGKIHRGIEERTADKKKNRERAAELLGVLPTTISDMELKRYELWKQQGYKCAYHMLWGKAGGQNFYGPQSNFREGHIPVSALRDGPNAAQIDHILPQSRTQDNSFHNLCLCISAANQHKGSLSPYEWIGRDNPKAWHDFEEWVKAGPFKGFKKRNFLLKDLSEKQERFCERNLNDTRYACRLAMRVVEEEYAYWNEKIAIPTVRHDGTAIRRVFARPGGITNHLRQAWGLQTLKKNEKGERFGDRHHALDAAIIAACSESLLQGVTTAFKKAEGNMPDPQPLPSPFDRHALTHSINNVFVSRAERCGIKGALHEETLRSIREEPDETGKPVKVLYERKWVSELKEKDLENIKDAPRCPGLIQALQSWFDRGKPKDDLPCLTHKDSRTGVPRKDFIRHVRIKRGNFTSGIEVRRGDGLAQADNGSMVRTDVFEKKGKYYLVPVYTWQVAKGIVPNGIIKGATPEAEWPVLDDDYSFLFSLFPDQYVLTEDGQGRVREGYFLGTDRSTGSISLALAHDRTQTITGIGVQRLKRFEKYRVDRLGRLHNVREEKRP